MISDPPRMLDELCVRLDVCLSPAHRSRIAITRFKDLDSLESAILHAAGLDPLKADRHLRFQIRECLQQFFEPD